MQERSIYESFAEGNMPRYKTIEETDDSFFKIELIDEIYQSKIDVVSEKYMKKDTKRCQDAILENFQLLGNNIDVYLHIYERVKEIIYDEDVESGDILLDVDSFLSLQMFLNNHKNYGKYFAVGMTDNGSAVAQVIKDDKYLYVEFLNSSEVFYILKSTRPRFCDSIKKDSIESLRRDISYYGFFEDDCR